MKLDSAHLNKSALAALLFMSVYHTFSYFLHEALLMGFIFCCISLFNARLLIKEQDIAHKPSRSNYIYLAIIYWFLFLLMLFTNHNFSIVVGIWFCVLILCTSSLLRPKQSIRIHISALFVFWLFAFSEASHSLIYIEAALALTVIMLLTGIIQKLITDQQSRLIIAQQTDHLTGCIQPIAFKCELDKAVQLHDRYDTPFSLICIKYQSSFNSENDLQTWLKELTCLYQSRLRKTDILCRFNSQKFMILLPSTNNKNAEMLSLDLRNCANAYEFSFKNIPHTQVNAPTLTFSTETFTQTDNVEAWLSNIQSH